MDRGKPLLRQALPCLARRATRAELLSLLLVAFLALTACSPPHLRAPERSTRMTTLVTTDGNPNANRARPLCEWPKFPKFTGAPGTENNAASYTCTE